MRKISPSTPVQTAVILAAGIGQRLGGLGLGQPKGALRLGARSIVEESIAKLRAAGITRLVLGTGFGAEYYRGLADEANGDIELCHNAMYAQSGSMYTLAQLAHCIDTDFLLLESDLVYEARALQVLQRAGVGSTMLVSGFSGAGDEVFVEASASGQLLALSKERRELGAHVIGELVGISRIAIATLRDMMERAELEFQRTLHVDYEQMLAAASAVHGVQCTVMTDLIWTEIDDASHFARARDVIYPRLAAPAGTSMRPASH